MKLTRRTMLAGAAAVAATPAFTQTFPAKPITLVVPFAAGDRKSVV